MLHADAVIVTALAAVRICPKYLGSFLKNIEHRLIMDNGSIFVYLTDFSKILHCMLSKVHIRKADISISVNPNFYLR